MAKTDRTTDLYDPRAGSGPLRVRSIRIDGASYEPARSNYFAVYGVESGSGMLAVDAASHRFGPGSLLFLLPYQQVRLVADEPIAAELIEFHANFLCVETFHAEVGCSGTLFNDPYGIPVLPLGDCDKAEVWDLFARIRREQTECGLAHEEVALSYLKVLLVLATRAKATGGEACGPRSAAHRHPVLTQLSSLIEQNYRKWHAPARYADALHLTPKTLGRIVRENLGTTLTALIRNRLLTHAKWQLLHTLRPVKEIALEVGFRDELYFSRLFKKSTGVSPTYFRDFETAIRGGSNLSISSGRSSIPKRPGNSDHGMIEEGGPDRFEAAAVPDARGRSHNNGSETV